MRASTKQTPAAQTLGPTIGGGLVGLLGAPVAIAVDAISYLVDAALNASIRVDEPRPDSHSRDLRGEIHDGLQWTYRHRTLGPFGGVDAPLVPRQWRCDDSAFSPCLAIARIRCLRIRDAVDGFRYHQPGRRVARNPVCGSDRIGPGDHPRARAYPITWLLTAIAPPTSAGDAVLFVALALEGLAAGLENSNEMGYWHALTPDELLGRVNATRRSINRTTATLGALLGGLIVGLSGERPALIGMIIAFAAAALLAVLSPLRVPTKTD